MRGPYLRGPAPSPAESSERHHDVIAESISEALSRAIGSIHILSIAVKELMDEVDRLT